MNELRIGVVQMPEAPTGIGIQPAHEDGCDCEDRGGPDLLVVICGELELGDAISIFHDLADALERTTIKDPVTGKLHGVTTAI